MVEICATNSDNLSNDVSNNTNVVADDNSTQPNDDIQLTLRRKVPLTRDEHNKIKQFNRLFNTNYSVMKQMLMEHLV